MLSISENAEGQFHAAPWAAQLIDLGVRASRFCANDKRLTETRQLYIAITVPIRNLAASLVATGWMLEASIKRSTDPIEQLQSLPTGTVVRMVTDTDIILGVYRGLEENRVHIGRKTYMTRVVRAVARVNDSSEEPWQRDKLPPSTSLGIFAGKPQLWFDYVCRPPAGLAIVGAKSRILEDLSTYVMITGSASVPTMLKDIVLPQTKHVASWATELIAPSSLMDDIDDVPQFSAVILDGAPAVKAVELLDAQLVIAVIDRSIMDDTAAEEVVQRRNKPGNELVCLASDMSWHPPAGVEALAFRTRR